MKNKIQIKSIFGKLLFEHESDDNSILKTLKEAVKIKTNLSGADLSNANLSGADLSGTNLRNANLSGTNLSDANLSGTKLSCTNLSNTNLRNANLIDTDLRNANLIDANLRNADLRNADLSNANLSGADLSGTNLRNANNKELAYMPQFCKWSHSMKGEKIIIGCKEKTIEEWQVFFDSKEEYSTKRGTDEFKQIQAIFESYKSYLKCLNS